MAEMFFGGRFVDLPDVERLDVIDPADRTRVDDVPVAGPDHVEAAVQEAEKAFTTWSSMPAAERGALLHAAARRVMDDSKELVRRLTAEQGKPLRESRIEIHRFVETLEHYAGLAKNLRGGYVPDLDEGAHGIIMKRPLGVVGAIVPWNFPTTLLGNKLGPALVTGNTVVAKPAETTPLTTLRIAQLMHDGGIPSGVFNVVTGGAATGEALVVHPRVRKIAFTGSTATGKRIMALAAGSVKHLTLELGGSDPMIVCDDADVDAAVSAASVGRFFNCGQACLAVKRLFVFESIFDEVLERLVGKARKLTVGPGTMEGVRLGPLHTDHQRRLVEEQVGDAIGSGAEVVHGGRRPSGEMLEKGFFYEPTILTGASSDSRVATEEVFGPALPVWPVGDLDEAIELANRSIYGLGSSVWTRDLDRANEAAERLEAGYTWINSAQKIYDELPFGGVKQSGFGKEHGIEALDHYVETRSVVVKRNAQKGTKDERCTGKSRALS